MYVDESGDPGLVNTPTRYFVLSGLVIHELRWTECLEQLASFRKRMRNKFGLLMREEIHTARLINRPGSLVTLKRNDRLSIIRHFTAEVANLPDANLINVVVDKHEKSEDFDVLVVAWNTLIQRFSNTMANRNFDGPANSDDRGLILPDQTDVKKVTEILRRMRRYNPVPDRTDLGSGYRNLKIKNLVEDPFFKDSRHSYFVQAADLAAFLLYQKKAPNAYIRRKGARSYFDRLDPILCKVASSSDPQGIVYR